jgi:hypothetical protein
MNDADKQKVNMTINNQVSSSTLLGAAGEYFVMYQLLRRGIIAALAPTGVPNADIIVSDQVGSRLAAIQVKARRDIGSDGGWHMKAKHEKIISPLLFYCFVDFGKSEGDPPKTWIVPSKVVSEVLSETHQAWFIQPGKNGQAHKPTEMRRFLPDFSKRNTLSYPLGWLKQYEEKWSLITASTI